MIGSRALALAGGIRTCLRDLDSNSQCPNSGFSCEQSQGMRPAAYKRSIIRKVLRCIATLPVFYYYGDCFVQFTHPRLASCGRARILILLSNDKNKVRGVSLL